MTFDSRTLASLGGALLSLLFFCASSSPASLSQCSGCEFTPGASVCVGGGYSCVITIWYSNPGTPDNSQFNGTCTGASPSCTAKDCKVTMAWIAHAPNNSSTAHFCEQGVDSTGAVTGQHSCSVAERVDETDPAGGHRESGASVVSVDCGATTRASVAVRNPQGTIEATCYQDLNCSACQ